MSKGVPPYVDTPSGPRARDHTREELGVPGEGGRRRQAELIDLLAHLAGNKRDGRLHFWHPPFGFLDPIQAVLAQDLGPDQGMGHSR
jgi:hypothetical protein